jgi:hypothetical protein
LIPDQPSISINILRAFLHRAVEPQLH